MVAGLDIQTGDAIDPEAEGILDNYIVKRNLLENRHAACGFIRFFLLSLAP